MDWPLASHYAAILQNPAIAFVDPELRSCRVRRDAHNQPQGICGQFAVVFAGDLADGRRVAIRAFTSDREERTQRYQTISDYLAQKGHIASLVKFQYQERGLRAITNGRGRLYPLITMEWVTGDSLYDWVGDRCRGGEQDRLRCAAGHWLHLVEELDAAEIGHGDFQHGNILVTPRDELKLVDYDGMCVPALVGRRNLETGMPPYQHSRRDDYTPLSPAIDRFSALFIYVALRALAAAPDLWKTHVEDRNYDKLLFSAEDLADPPRSVLMQAVAASPDRDVVRLTEALLGVYRGPMGDVPRLKEVVEAPAVLQPVSPSPPEAATAPQALSGDAADLWPVADPAVPDSAGQSTAWPAPGSTTVVPHPTDAVRTEPMPEVAWMLEALQAKASDQFCEHFDARLIRGSQDQFAAYRRLLVEWVQERFRSPEKIGLRPTRGRDSVARLPGDKGNYQLHWTWPHPRFSQSCIVGLSRHSVAANHGPDEVALEMRRPVTREAYEGGRGLILPTGRAPAGCQVIVWAVIDLGFESLYSGPLVLGPLRLGTASRPRGSGGW